MAYSKGTISIPNVTGNVVITVTTQTKPAENLINLSRTAASLASGVALYSNSSYWDETKYYNNILLSTGGSTTTATVSDLGSDTVTISAAGGVGAVWCVQLEGGESYKLTYDYSGTGKTRVYYATNVDGTASSGTVLEDSSSTIGVAGSSEFTITMPSGNTAWLFLGLSTSSSLEKTFTNVKLVEA